VATAAEDATPVREAESRAEADSRDVDRCVELGDTDGFADTEFALDSTPEFDTDGEAEGEDVRTSAAVEVDVAKLSDVAFGVAELSWLGICERDACLVGRSEKEMKGEEDGLSDGVVTEVSRGDEETAGVFVSGAVARAVSVTSADGDIVALF
jgi:hypothetical protein